MSNKPMMYYPTEVVRKIIEDIPKNSKSKYINLCVELINSEPLLQEMVKSKLFGFKLSPVNITETKGTDYDKPHLTTNEAVNPVEEVVDSETTKISKNKVKFGL